MTLRCVGCHEHYPEHSPVCWVPAQRARAAARERWRHWVWGVVVWACLGVALGLLGVALLGWVGQL